MYHDNNNSSSESSRKSSSSTESKKSDPKDLLFFDNFCHYKNDSSLTRVTPQTNFSGFTNFTYLILATSVARLLVENVYKYGLSANPFRWVVFVMYDQSSVPIFFLVVALFGYFLASLVLERLYVWYMLSNNRLITHKDESQPTTTNWMDNMEFVFKVRSNEEFYFQLMYLSLIGLLLGSPIYVCVFTVYNRYLLGLVSLTYAAASLKLYSYHQVNSWWRTRTLYGVPMKQMLKSRYYKKDFGRYFEEELEMGTTINVPNEDRHSLLQYPQNLTLSNMYHFQIAPTLCYQLNYPRTKSINFLFLMRCLLEFVFLAELMLFCYEQWIMIPLSSHMVPINEYTFVEFLLRWSKLSMGLIFMWFIGFYMIFQSWLNFLAEISHFADRQFYHDWWNAESVAEFWRKWNAPVHNWCVRHIYKPLRLLGYSEVQSMVVVFFISGIFHEYLVSVPLRMWNIHFMLGMAVQAGLDFVMPLVRTSGKLGNGWVWCMLTFGMPLVLIGYYHQIVVSQAA